MHVGALGDSSLILAAPRMAAVIHGIKWPLERFLETPLHPLQSQEGALAKQQVREATKLRFAPPNIPADLSHPCPSPSGEGYQYSILRPVTLTLGYTPGFPCPVSVSQCVGG